MSDFKDKLQEYIHSSAHLSKRHVHPKLLKMFEVAGMTAVFDRGQGQYLWDTNGDRFLDFLSGGGVYFMGRNQPEINEMLRDILDLELPNLTIVNASLLGGLLAEKLLAMAGPHYGKAILANTGTETAEVGIRFARYVTRRRRFLYLDGAFHGRTYGAISMCGSAALREGQEPLMPTCTPLPPNDIRALKRELRYGDVAAFFFEPVQGMTCLPMDPDYLREAEALCKEYGTLFVADEVQSGLGRTGHWFYTSGHGIRPDMLSVSKTLSGGQVPVSAVLVSEEIYQKVYEKFQSGPFYFSTFAENNLAMAAGIATLEFLEKHDAANEAARVGKRIVDGVNALKERYDCIDRIQGAGLMLSIYFKDSVKPRLAVEQKLLNTGDASAFAAAVNVDMYRKHKILVQIPGVGVNAIKILPPFCTTDADVTYFLNALDEVLGTYYTGVGPAIGLGRTALGATLGQASSLIPSALAQRVGLRSASAEEA